MAPKRSTTSAKGMKAKGRDDIASFSKKGRLRYNAARAAQGRLGSLGSAVALSAAAAVAGVTAWPAATS